MQTPGGLADSLVFFRGIQVCIVCCPGRPVMITACQPEWAKNSNLKGALGGLPVRVKWRVRRRVTVTRTVCIKAHPGPGQPARLSRHQPGPEPAPSRATRADQGLGIAVGGTEQLTTAAGGAERGHNRHH